jgi:Holliday junction resolvase RusA-like endonuclease
MKLILPGEFVTLNEYVNAERSNKYAGASIKKSETERVFWECRSQQLSAILGQLDYTFTWYVKDRRRDPDNVFFSTKFILDGLYKAGIIESDTQAHVGRIIHNKIIVDRENPRVEILIKTNVETNKRSEVNT